MFGKTTYDNEALRNDLQGFVSLCSQNNHFYSNLFQFQYYTGCRLRECTQQNRIEPTKNRELIIHTLKGGNDRIITVNDIPEWLLRSVADDPYQFTFCSASTAAYYFRCLFPHYPVYTDSKSVTTHLFRHSIVKHKIDSGLTYNEVASWLGEVDVKNVQGYYKSVLKY